MGSPSTRRKPYSELTLADDFMFWKVMSRPEIAKQFLESLLGRSIKSIEFSGGQSTHKEFANRPGIRFDVEFHGDGKIYDIEMQNSGSSSERGILELTNRARYYHAMLTQSKYDSEMGYAALPDSYVIFICRFDPFGVGRAVYTQRPYILGLERQLPAHEVTMYLCTRYKDNVGSGTSKDILEFLNYLETSCVPAGNALVKSADLEVARLRYSPEERREYMSLQEMLRDERRGGLLTAVEKLVRRGYSKEQAMELLLVDENGVDLEARGEPDSSGSSNLSTLNLQ